MATQPHTFQAPELQESLSQVPPVTHDPPPSGPLHRRLCLLFSGCTRSRWGLLLPQQTATHLLQSCLSLSPLPPRPYAYWCPETWRDAHCATSRTPPNSCQTLHQISWALTSHWASSPDNAFIGDDKLGLLKNGALYLPRDAICHHFAYIFGGHRQYITFPAGHFHTHWTDCQEYSSPSLLFF